MKWDGVAELDEMRVFMRVAEFGSFAAAAEDLRRTPTAISKLMGRLEERLGVQLLTRTTRRLSLVEEGETFLRRCREILAALKMRRRKSAGPAGNYRAVSRSMRGRVSAGINWLLSSPNFSPRTRR